MKKYIFAIMIIFLCINTICAKEKITPEKLDQIIIDISLETGHVGDPPTKDIINEIQEYNNLSDKEIRDSLYRLLKIKLEKKDWNQEIRIVANATMLLQYWGDESSIVELSKRLKHSRTLNSNAYETIIFINNFELNFLLDYLQKCINRKRDTSYDVSYIITIIRELCSRYKKTTTNDKKQHYSNVLKEILLLHKNNGDQDNIIKLIIKLLEDCDLTLADFDLKEKDFIANDNKSSFSNNSNNCKIKPVVTEKKEEAKSEAVSEPAKFPKSIWGVLSLLGLAIIGGITWKIKSIQKPKE